MMHNQALPNEIVELILRFACKTFKDCYRFCLVCHLWKSIIYHNKWTMPFILAQENKLPPFLNIENLMIDSCASNQQTLEKICNIYDNLHSISLDTYNGSLESLVKLEQLEKFSATFLQPFNYEEFQFLVNIREIKLHDLANICENGIIHLQKTKKLDFSVSPSFPQEYDTLDDNLIGRLISVEELSLAGRKKFTDGSLMDFTNLKKLKLDHSRITGCFLTIMTTLEHLSMKHCALFNFQDFFPYSEKCFQNLKFIDLTGSYITNDYLQYLSNIETVILNECRSVTGNGLQHLGSVQHLQLENCTQIVDRAISFLSNVRVLSIKGCNKITNEGLKNLEMVEILNVSGCKEISTSGLAHLPRVKKIIAVGCTKVSTMHTLPKNLKFVEIVK